MDVKTIMTNDPTGQALVEFSRQTAKKLVTAGLTRSQIRSIFTEVRQIEARWNSTSISKADTQRRLNMLRPKLEYQTARHGSVDELKRVLSDAIVEINNAREDDEKNRRFRIFMDLFEAILAYHRAEGGKN